MKNFLTKTLLACLFFSLCSFNSVDIQSEDFGFCSVKLTYTNPNTGESYNEYYYSTSRTSAQDCANGAWALANGFNFLASDFKRSPVILEIAD